MAQVSIGITRDSGISISASAEVEDEMVIDMAGMIGAMIFDASLAMPEPELTPNGAQSG